MIECIKSKNVLKSSLKTHVLLSNGSFLYQHFGENVDEKYASVV